MHGVSRIVGFVSHHNNKSIALGVAQAKGDSTAKAMFASILDWVEGWNSLLQLLENFPCFILATIVDDDNFVGHMV